MLRALLLLVFASHTWAICATGTTVSWKFNGSGVDNCGGASASVGGGTPAYSTITAIEGQQSLITSDTNYFLWPASVTTTVGAATNYSVESLVYGIGSPNYPTMLFACTNSQSTLNLTGGVGRWISGANILFGVQSIGTGAWYWHILLCTGTTSRKMFTFAYGTTTSVADASDANSGAFTGGTTYIGRNPVGGFTFAPGLLQNYRIRTYANTGLIPTTWPTVDPVGGQRSPLWVNRQRPKMSPSTIPGAAR